MQVATQRLGFTLIELIIVIIIIGILTAVSAPMLGSNVRRAQRAEAVAALGSIRTAERMYYMERGVYTSVGRMEWDDGYSVAPLGRYINSADLNGRYYNFTQYSVEDVEGINYTIYCRIPETSGSCTCWTMDMSMNEGGFINYGS